MLHMKDFISYSENLFQPEGNIFVDRKSEMLERKYMRMEGVPARPSFKYLPPEKRLQMEKM